MPQWQSAKGWVLPIFRMRLVWATVVALAEDLLVLIRAGILEGNALPKGCMCKLILRNFGIGLVSSLRMSATRHCRDAARLILRVICTQLHVRVATSALQHCQQKLLIIFFAVYSTHAKHDFAFFIARVFASAPCQPRVFADLLFLKPSLGGT